jgi:hypothetical protein
MPRSLFTGVVGSGLADGHRLPGRLSLPVHIPEWDSTRVWRSRVPFEQWARDRRLGQPLVPHRDVFLRMVALLTRKPMVDTQKEHATDPG